MLVISSTTKLKGLRPAGGILDRIVEAKAKRIDEARQRTPIDHLVERAAASHSRRSLMTAVSQPGRVNIIAEIKQRSPSKGIIREDFDPVRIAGSYEEGGAAALSVLAEEDFFGGSLEHVEAIRERVALPLLRKDFIFDEYQLYESIARGADAVLLITAILEDELLARLIQLTYELGLEALVEVHSADEMKRAAGAGASIIGVNNRDLTTFNVDLETSLKLAPLAPELAILISESGITTGTSIRQLRSAGFNAFLIGEHLMRAEDPGQALKRLIDEGTG